MASESYGLTDPQPMNSPGYSGYSPTQPVVADSDASYSRSLLKELGLEDDHSNLSAVMDLNAFRIGNGYSGFTPFDQQQYVPAAGLSYVR
jgi:hypothetical protein